MKNRHGTSSSVTEAGVNFAGYVYRHMDWRLITREDEAAIEWTWTATTRWTRCRAEAGRS